MTGMEVGGHLQGCGGEHHGDAAQPRGGAGHLEHVRNLWEWPVTAFAFVRPRVGGASFKKRFRVYHALRVRIARDIMSRYSKLLYHTMGSELAIDIGTSPYLRASLSGLFLLFGSRKVSWINLVRLRRCPSFFDIRRHDSSHINHAAAMDNLHLKKLLFAPVDLILSFLFSMVVSNEIQFASPYMIKATVWIMTIRRMRTRLWQGCWWHEVV